MAAGINPMEIFLAQIMLLLRQAIDGYGFSPNEEELINYLKSEEPGCRGGFCIIPTVENIYEIDPWKLKAEFSKKSIIPPSDREWWFICPQTQSRRVRRKTPCGSSWKITSARTDINAKVDGTKIGSKTILAFPDGRGFKGGKCGWVIHEYRLHPGDLNRDYVLCHLMRKQDEKADDSTSRSEDGVANLAQLESFLHRPDDEGSISEVLIIERMDSLMEPSQHQNQVFSLCDLLQLLQRGKQSLINSFPSTMHSPNIGSPSAKDFSLNNSLTDISIELESSQGTAKEDEWRDAMPKQSFEKIQLETAASNIELCMSFDEIAARAKDGQISLMENRQILIELLHGGAPLVEIAHIIQRMLNISHVSSAKPIEFSEKPKTPMSESQRIYDDEDPRLEKVEELEIASTNAKLEYATLDEYAANAKGLEHQEHSSAGNSPKRRRLDMPENNQIQ